MFRRAFLLEDNAGVVTALRIGFKNVGLAVESAETLAEAFEKLEGAEPPDVFLVDLILPDGNGLDLVRWARDEHPAVPIAILTGLGESEDVVHGLEQGADLYIKKPFTASEILAHLEALYRRMQRDGGAVSFGGVAVDLLHRRASHSGRSVRLTDVESRLLAALLTAQGEIVSREDLLLQVWNLTFDPGTGLLHSHIRNLRRKLRQIGADEWIQAARGRGYRFEESEAA